MAWILTDLKMEQTGSSSWTISFCYESEQEQSAVMSVGVSNWKSRLFYRPAAEGELAFRVRTVQAD